MEISGAGGSASSAGRQPDQGMMIFLSVALLLDQIRQLLSAGRGSVAYCGVDSSFQVRFTVRKGEITAAESGREIEKLPVQDFITALLAATDDFADRELDKLPESDPARADLLLSLADFRKLA
ncbi:MULTISPECIES: hypothetical protein [unclassified Kitasatospora]|uniref:hypothetical protein n=1 Tax=unclassified Kitasatospora TaxID=2633591 RepID=UPI0012FBC7D6|nr:MULTISPECIES: hypothetical protein [unclassified Kitasatospora]